MKSKDKIRCLSCVHGSITSIGSLRCARFDEVLSMNPRLLIPSKSNGIIRGFRIRNRIDNCPDFRGDGAYRP
jgi:hypothetical protein